MLDFFIDWAKSVVDGQASGGMEASIALSEVSNNRSARLDLDTPAAVARITCWQDGSYDAEITALASEKQIYAHRGTVQTEKPLSQQFDHFFDAFSSLTK